MDDKSIEKLLKKSKLASAYAMLPSPELRRAIAIEYGRLLGENDLSDPMLAGHLRTSILPAVAFHRCLQEYGYTQSASLMAIRAAVLKNCQTHGKYFSGDGKTAFLFLNFPYHVLYFHETQLWPEKDGYLSGNGMMRMQSKWDCRSCLYVDVFRRYSVPELAPIFCEK